MTASSISDPNTFLPGTWERLPEGYALKTVVSSAATTYAAGKTGGTKLTAAQSGVGAHTHTRKGYISNAVSGQSQAGQYIQGYGSATAVDWDSTKTSSTSANASSAHDHTAGMPANIGVYCWKRIA
jgi:hypothetical protein